MDAPETPKQLRDGIATLLPLDVPFPWRTDDVAGVIYAANGRIVAAVDPFAESFGDPAAANMAHIIVLAVNTAAGVDTESTQ